MPVRRRVFRNNPGQPDHGRPHVAFAVDARELVASGAYTASPPDANARPQTPEGEIVEEPKLPPQANPDDQGSGGEGETLEPTGDDPHGLGRLSKDHLLGLADVFQISNAKTMTKANIIQSLLTAEAHNPGLVKKREGYIKTLGSPN